MARPRKPRDSQRKAVYKWEDRVLGVYTCIDSQHKIPLHECRSLIEDLWRKYAPEAYREKPPEVRDGRGRRSACGDSEVIKLPRWCRNPVITVHELTHGLVDVWYGHDVVAWHGPEFVRFYIELLVRELGFSRSMLEEHLTTGKRRVKVSSLDDWVRKHETK